MHLYSVYSSYGSISLCLWKSTFGIFRDAWAKLKPQCLDMGWWSTHVLSVPQFCYFKNVFDYTLGLYNENKVLISLVWKGLWLKIEERNDRQGSWRLRQGRMKEDKQPMVLQQVRTKILEAGFQRGMVKSWLPPSSFGEVKWTGDPDLFLFPGCR